MIRSDAPTGSRDALMIKAMHGAQTGWSLDGYDAACAYLQPGQHGKVISRTLLLKMPKQHPPPGTQPSEIMQAHGAIYGTKDAGREWYLYLRRHLEAEGFLESRLEKGLYGKTGRDGSLIGVIHTHVDDMLVASKNCPEMTAVMARLTKALHLKHQTGTSVYCGRTFTITPTAIHISMEAASRACDPEFSVVPARRKVPDDQVTVYEKGQYRSLLGKVVVGHATVPPRSRC